MVNLKCHRILTFHTHTHVLLCVVYGSGRRTRPSRVFFFRRSSRREPHIKHFLIFTSRTERNHFFIFFCFFFFFDWAAELPPWLLYVFSPFRLSICLSVCRSIDVSRSSPNGGLKRLISIVFIYKKRYSSSYFSYIFIWFHFYDFLLLLLLSFLSFFF